jgi:ribosome-associated heat shock protein Hsp15
VQSGKVRLNGERTKPGKDVKPGDEIEVRSGELQWIVAVRAVALRRGPAPAAALLYAEGEESRQKRERMIVMRHAGPHPGRDTHGRPTKRDRRMIRRFTGE